MILRPCPFCEKPIPHRMNTCPYCHRDDQGKQVAMDSAAPPPEDPHQFFENDLKDLSNEDPYLREQATVRMAQKGFGVAQALISILSDGAKPGLAAIAKILGRIRDRRAIPVLVGAMKQGDEDLRMAAVWALAQFREPEVLQALAGDLERHHPTVQGYIAFILGSWRDPTVLPVLAKLLKHNHREVAFQAACALREMGDPAAIPALRRAGRRPDPVVRAAALQALRHLGGSTVASSTWVLWAGIAGVVLVAVVLFVVYK